MRAVFVTVRIKPELRGRFLEVIEDDSTCSVRDEPGCVQFSVLQDGSDPDTYHFYEVYQDEAAVAAHLQTPHLARWLEASKEVCSEPSQVTRVTSIFPRDYQ